MRRTTFTPHAVQKKHPKRKTETLEAKVMRIRAEQVKVAQRRVKVILSKMTPEQQAAEIDPEAMERIKTFLAESAKEVE